MYSARGSRGGSRGGWRGQGGLAGSEGGALDGPAGPPASAPGGAGFGLGGTMPQGAGLEGVSPERRVAGGSPLQGVASLKDEELEELLSEPLIDWQAWEARVSRMLEEGHGGRGRAAGPPPTSTIVRRAPLPPLEVSNLSLESSSKSDLASHRITLDSGLRTERNPTEGTARADGRPLYSTRGSRKFSRHVPPTSTRGGRGTPRSNCNFPRAPANTPHHRGLGGSSLATPRGVVGKAANNGVAGTGSPQRGLRRSFHPPREGAGSRHGNRWGEEASVSTPKAGVSGARGGRGAGGASLGEGGVHGHAAFPRSKMEEELQKSAEETAAIGGDLVAGSDSDEMGGHGEAEGGKDGDGGLGRGDTGGAGRSQSPSIMWRPSARVKLATDLPLELLHSGLLLPATGGTDGASGGGGDRERSVFTPGGLPSGGRGGGALSASLGGFSGLQSPGGASEPPGGLMSPWGTQKAGTLGRTGSRQGPRSSQAPLGPNSWVRVAEPRKPRKYGAWYIPPEEWASEMARMEKEQAGGHDPGGPIEFSEDQSKEAEELGEQILSLYSSKMYKEYIRRCNHRVPHYLARVESPKVNKRTEKETALLEFTARFHGTPGGG